MHRFLWLIAFVLMLAFTKNYELHDSDSRLYAAMSYELSLKPIAQWCAPEWNGHWQRQGLFFEHPPGYFWLAAFLNRLGFPPYQATYAINFLCLLLEIILLFKIAEKLQGITFAKLACFAWILNPTFVQYLVRGSHEHPVTFALLLALYGLIVAEKYSVALWTLAVLLGVWIKGLSGLGIIAVSGVYFLYRPSTRLFGQMAIGISVLVLSWIAFEYWYELQTHTSFLQGYFTAQVQRSVAAEVNLAQKLSNLIYYLIRPLWFFFPWIFFILHGVYKNLRLNDARFSFKNFSWSIGLWAFTIFVLAFSLARRKAERYLIPAYPVLCLSAAWYLNQSPNALKSCLEKYSVKTLSAWLLLGIVIATGLKIYMGTYHYQFIRFE